MKVFIEKEKRTKELDFSGTADELLKQIGINRETVLIVKNDELVTKEEILSNNDEIKLLSVISGG